MEIYIFFGNNFTQGRNHGRRKDYFPAEGTLAGKRNKFLRWAMAYLIALNGNRLGNTYLIFLDGDPIATRPEESWFTLPDVPQILAWCSKPPIWQVKHLTKKVFRAFSHVRCMMNIFRCMMKPVDLQLQGRLFFDLFLFAPCHQTGCELGAWFGFFAFWVLFCSKILHSGIIAATLDAKKERFLLHPTFDLFLQVGGVWSDDIVIFWQFETHSWSGKRLQKSTTSYSLSSLSMRWAFFTWIFAWIFAWIWPDQID